jgi:hypothetical protein
MPKKKTKIFKKAYVVTVDMGYGHQRASYPLKDIAASPVEWSGEGNIISANTYAGIPKHDRQKWEASRKLYERISRMKRIPLFGRAVFGIMNHLQRIEPFYPERDLSTPIFQVRQIYKMIGRGWGKHLIDLLNKDPLPLVTSFFITAFFADEHGYKGDIYCICTDTDISRAWVPLKPKKTRIKYLAPNKRVKERLKLYGVSENNIYVTGFPLPKENLGRNLQTLRRCLGCRISNLDPEGKYQKKYEHTLREYLGVRFCDLKAGHPLTITFAVGGAGAQREIGGIILGSLHSYIKKGEINLNLVAGSRRDVFEYYDKVIKDFRLGQVEGKSVKIIYDEHKMHYFAKFNQVLLTTDILWTKPSELSFYAALGLPIIMSPTIGSQEEHNRTWLHSIGAGIEQEDPRYTDEWLFDWLQSGWLAEAAMEGFMDAPRNGAHHIENIVLRGERSEIEDVHLL